MRKVLRTGLLLVLVVTICLGVLPAFAEEGGDQGAQITEAPTVEITEAPQTPPPATEPPQTPAPVTPPPSTQPPATESPQTPSPESPTPAPTTASPDPVQLNMYVYTASDAPASGYTVKIGDSSSITDSKGLAKFANLAMAQYSVQITAPDGNQSSGRFYLHRAGSTRITDQAMGGTYGVDVENGVNTLYMLITFVPQEALEVRTLSNSQPALPEPAPSQQATATPTLSPEQSIKALTATFLDEEGQPIAGLNISIRADNGTGLDEETDTRGEIDFPQVPYGHYVVAASAPDAPGSNFELTIVPAQSTGIAQNAGTSFVVNSDTNAKHLYLEFRRAGSLFTLTEASDSPIGGMSSMMLGIIVVAVIVVIVIVLIVVARKRKKRSKTVMTARKTNYNPDMPRTPGIHGSQEDSLHEAGPRKTGGANKFDFEDRSRM